jgi:predicted membrane protein
VLYVLASKIRKTPIDFSCLKGLTFALWGFLMFTVVLEGLEFANLVYKGKEGGGMIVEYVSGPLFVRYFILQFAVGALLPIALMGILIARDVRGKAFFWGVTIAALLVLMNVLMMRWNVVIGGQEIAKTTRGLLTYHLPTWGRESLVAAAAVTLAPLGLLWVLTRLFPPWHEPARST